MPKSVFGGAHSAVVTVLTNARKKSGLTQAELGEIVGKDQSFISLIENSQRRIDLVEFLALCYAMKIDPRVAFDEIAKTVPPDFHI